MGEYIYFLKMICYNEVQYYTTGEYTNLDPRSRSRITDDYMQYRRSLSSNIFLFVLFLFWHIFSWGFASFTVKLFFFICNFSVAIQFCLPNMESKKGGKKHTYVDTYTVCTSTLPNFFVEKPKFCEIPKYSTFSHYVFMSVIIDHKI